MFKLLQVKGYWPAGLWAFLIFILYILPSNKIPSQPDWELSFDKLVHFGLFAILGFLWLNGRNSNKVWSRSELVQVIVLLFIYGLLLEMIQLLVPSRSFHWLDQLANAMGTLAGNFIYLGVVKLKKGLGQ